MIASLFDSFYSEPCFVTVDIKCLEIFLFFDSDRNGLILDEISGSLDCSLDLIVRIHVDLYLIHHLEVSQLTELLDLGDNLSYITLFDEFRCESGIEYREHVVVHAYYESFF